MRPRKVLRLLCAAAVLTTVWLLLPVSLGGHTDYVVTHGISMEPGFHTGDLAIVRASGTYRVGDVVAYRSQSLHTRVMHRIVAVQGGRYLLKGDNNTFIDPEHPRAQQLIGTLALRIPQGGSWLSRLTHPLGLALATLVMVTTSTHASRHRGRRRRRATMKKTGYVRSPAVAAAMSSPSGRVALTAAAALAALGVLLGFVAWKAPRDLASSPVSGPGATTTFAYHAAVRPSAAYDTDTVTSPDPVFRRLTDHVTLDVHYAGPAGVMTIGVDVVAGNGWHTTLPLLPPTTFDTHTHNASLPLDMGPIEERAKRAAQVIGMPYESLMLAVHPKVRTIDGQQLSPTLNLVLTPTQLKLAAGPETLTVASPASQAPAKTPAPGVASTVSVIGHRLNTSDAAMVAAALLAAAALLGLLTIVQSGRRPPDEAHAIHARYGDLLLPIQPPATSHLGETVDVQDFTALARTAQRYGLVIMTWLTGEGQTFVVQDQSVRYRYTTASHGLQTRNHRRTSRPHIAIAPYPPSPERTTASL